MDRIDLQLKFKGVHHRGKSLIFDDNGSDCYLSRQEIALRDMTSNRPVNNLAPGQIVIVNIPKWYALKVGLLREDLN